jgi:hypothetical protein
MYPRQRWRTTAMAMGEKRVRGHEPHPHTPSVQR